MFSATNSQGEWGINAKFYRLAFDSDDADNNIVANVNRFFGFP
jgi:hypothetical protein